MAVGKSNITKYNNTLGDNKDYSGVSPIVEVQRSPVDTLNYGFSGTIEESGWYYDQQLTNPLTSVQLLSNKTADWNTGDPEKNDPGGYWVYKNCANNEYLNLIAKSILSEDFTIDIGNNWIDNAAGDAIGDFLNSPKKVTPYLGVVRSALKSMSNSQQDKRGVVSDNGLNFTRYIMDAVDYFGKSGESGTKLLEEIYKASNGAFMAQGCSFTYYGGTGISFGNLGMKYTIFPGYDKDGNWVSTIDQVVGLLPYCMGTIQDITGDMAGAVKDVLNDSANKAGGFVKSFWDVVKEKTEKNGKTIEGAINDYIKWQAPPAGYDLDSPKNLDKRLPGTLCLEVGSHYKIEGLVISNISLQLSKQMVRNPGYFITGTIEKSGGHFEDAISPLYCEVNLGLRPVSKYSSVSLGRFIQGNIDKRYLNARDMLATLQQKIDEQTNTTI